MGKTLVFIILAIGIKSICQYYLGANETSFNKILSSLDSGYYQGSILGAIILNFWGNNWYNIWDYLQKYFIFKLDSDDEDSGNEGLKDSGKDKLKGNNISSNAIDKGKNLEEVTGNKGLPLNLDSEDGYKIGKSQLLDIWVKTSLTAQVLSEDTRNYIKNNLALSVNMGRLATLDLNVLSVNNVDHVNNVFITLLMEHGATYSKFERSRLCWIVSRSVNLKPENLLKVREHINNAEAARDKYIYSIKDVGKHKDPTTQVKVYYAALNHHRNVVNKELNKADEIILKDLKASSFCRLKDSECKNLIKTLNSYTEAKTQFNNQDSKLKKLLGEVINKK